jgi:hypothetical protein
MTQAFLSGWRLGRHAAGGLVGGSAEAATCVHRDTIEFEEVYPNGPECEGQAAMKVQTVHLG